jgi:hypothetical protein
MIWAAQSLGRYNRLMTGVPEAHLRREYRRRFWNLLKKRCVLVPCRLFAHFCHHF